MFCTPTSKMLFWNLDKFNKLTNMFSVYSLYKDTEDIKNKKQPNFSL